MYVSTIQIFLIILLFLYLVLLRSNQGNQYFRQLRIDVLDYNLRQLMKINTSQQSKSQTNSKGGTKYKSQREQEQESNSSQTSHKYMVKTVQFTNSQRQMQIILSIIIVVLSTLWVQITMQRHAPFIRTAQCYFNQIILQHYSQDIYQGKDVIYWKTGQYYRYEDVLGVFSRLNQTIYELDTNSLFDISTTNNQDGPEVEMLAKYGRPNQNTIDDLISNQSSLSDLSNLFNQTVFNRSFYQNLWQLQISFRIPIKYRQSQCYLKVKIESEVYSSLMMNFFVNVDILDRDDNLVSEEFNKDKLGIRKLHDSFNMQLSIPFIFWVIVFSYIILLALELRYLVKKNREVSRLLRIKIKEQKRIEKLLQDMNKSQQNLKVQKINESDQSEEVIDFNDEHFQIPQKYKMPVTKRIKKIGIYYIIEFFISFVSLIMCYHSNNGIICFFAWLKIMVYLSQTKNKYMFGLLFQQTIPIYLKILLNIGMLISAFVLFNSLVFPTTAKFQTLKLGYFEYIFNYFQYGIYQNFILAFQQYGLLTQFFYFLQLIYLLYIGNNILQSVLANQVMKNSYVDTVKEMIQELKVDCPACGADPRSQIKSSEFFGNSSKSNPFMSNIMKQDRHQSRADFQSQISKDQFKIVVQSPQLSPFFPSKVQRKQSQVFLSPKLKNGNFQKQMKEIKKKVEQEQITSKSRIEEINEINNKYDGTKTLKQLKLQISQSRIQQRKQDKFHKRIKSKIEILFKKISKFNQFKLSTPNLQRNDAKIKQTKIQILQNLLQKIEQLKSKVSSQIH